MAEDELNTQAHKKLNGGVSGTTVVKGLDEAAADRGARSSGLPPVHLWNPPYRGPIPMEIRRDGTWYYMGTPIRRKPMVRLFSSVLRRDGDAYFLVTPVEKVGINVEDVPFVVVEMRVEQEGHVQILSFRTQVGDWVVADGEHPLRMEFGDETGEPAPYIHVRSRLDGRINRAVYYDLVELGEDALVDGERQFGVWSSGVFFPFAPSDQVHA